MKYQLQHNTYYSWHTCEENHHYKLSKMWGFSEDWNLPSRNLMTLYTFSWWTKNVYIFHAHCHTINILNLSQYLTNLMHKICFTIGFISCLYMFRAHVLIITYRCDDTRGCVMLLWIPDDEHMCSKHVEAWNKTHCKTNFVHQVG